MNKILKFLQSKFKIQYDKNKENVRYELAQIPQSYGVTYKLHEGMKSLEWSAEVIQKYTVDHAHEVNEESAAKHRHNHPDLPKNDDANG